MEHEHMGIARGSNELWHGLQSFPPSSFVSPAGLIITVFPSTTPKRTSTLTSFVFNCISIAKDPLRSRQLGSIKRTHDEIALLFSRCSLHF